MNDRYIFTDVDRVLAIKSRKKTYKYDWNQIQLEYDNGLSFTDIIKKYKMSSRTITIAVRDGRLKSRNLSESMSLFFKNNPEKNPMKNPVSVKKLSEYAKEHNYGGLKIGSGRGKGCWYESKIAGKVYIRSTYELEYVRYLDKNNILWQGNLKYFLYSWENKTRKYYPDFYLIDTDEYIEVKGYKTEKDDAKWSQFPYKLKVLMKSELLSLGLKIK